MIGDWVDEGPDSEVRVNCRWSEDGNFLVRSFTVKQQGKPVMTVSQRIGWDPLARQIRSWEFDSEGGFGEGTWSRDGERWVDQAHGRPARGGRPPRPPTSWSRSAPTWCGGRRPTGSSATSPSRATMPTSWSASRRRRGRSRPARRRLPRPRAPTRSRDEPQRDDPDAGACLAVASSTGRRSPAASAAAAASRRRRLRRRRLPRRRMGGFRGGEMGGFRGGEMGGMRYGGGGGFRGGYGGMSSFGRTPSFSSPGTFDRAGGEFRGITRTPGVGGAAEGMLRGPDRVRAPARVRTRPRGEGPSTTAPRGGGGRARRAARPGAGSYGVQVTTAGGRSFTDVGRAGGAVGPGGNAVGGRSNIAVASGPRGTAVAGSRSGFAASAGAAERGRSARLRGRTAPPGSGPTDSTPTGPITQGWVHGYWNGHGDAAWGWRRPVLGLGLGAGAGPRAWAWAGAWRPGASARRSTAWATCPTTTPITATAAGRGRSAGRGRPLRLLAADRHHERARADESVADPAMALFDAARDVVQAGQLRPRPCSRPTTPWRSCPTTRPCTSSAPSACSPWGGTTRPPRPSTPCSRSGPAGTGRR